MAPLPDHWGFFSRQFGYILKNEVVTWFYKQITPDKIKTRFIFKRC